MFYSLRQLERYEKEMKKRNFKDELYFWIELFFIVAGFVFICDVAYRLSFII